MRYTDDHKERIRERIIESAARRLRRDGLRGVSIPAVMKEVGLTHGGFYCHFRDRDELVSAAVTHAAEGTATGVLEHPDGVTGMLGTYLSPEHLEHPEQGCVLAALGSEGRQQSLSVRRTFAHIVRGFLHRIERQLHPNRAADQPSDAALVLASQMIGAVVLGRLAGDAQLSVRILTAARKARA